MSGILLKKSCYYYRKVLPKDVQQFVGKREVQASLRTHLKLPAKDKASYLALQLNTAIYELRAGYATTDNALLKERFLKHVQDAVTAIRQSDAERLPVIFETKYDSKPEAPQIKIEQPSLDKLSVFFERYKEHMMAKGAWKEARIKEYDQALDLAMLIMDDKSINLYSREDLRTYRDSMTRLPTNRTKRKAYRDKSVKELLKMDIPKSDRLMGKTINGQLNRVLSVFKWAAIEYEGSVNITLFDDLTVSEKDSISYKPYTTKELQTLFKNGLYLEADTTYKYWLPLLGLYTGGRIEEICQMRIADVKSDDAGVLYFNIHDEDSQNLKTENSYRKVPVHKTLVKLGFLDYLEFIKSRGHAMLLPDLPYDSETGKWSIYASKQYNKLASDIKIKTDRSKCFHSFRKNITDALAPHAPKDSMVVQLLGHSQKGMTFSRYFSEYSLKEVSSILDQIEYDIPLDELKGRWQSIKIPTHR